MFLTAQVYQVLPQRYEFKDSMKLTKNRNNAAGDSILSTDINGRVINILKPAGGGGGSTDTTSLSNRINLRVKYTDTAAMLTPYVNAADWGLIKTGQRVKADSTAFKDVFWARRGNTAVTGDYIGTNNGQDLVFKTNGNENTRITPLGKVDIIDAAGKRQMSLDPVNKYWALGDWAGDFGSATSIHISDSIGEVRIDGDLTVQGGKAYDFTHSNFPLVWDQNNLGYTSGWSVDSIWRLSDSIKFRVIGPASSPVKAGTFGIYAPTASAGISGLTTNELVYGNSATTIASLPVATYPSLTELSYVKGVTSGVQTQFANYLPLAGATYTTTTGDGLALTSSTVTTGNLMKLTNTGTAAGSNTKNVLAIVSSGANATSSQTVTGQTISVTNTGTSNINVGLKVTASGAGTGNNYAIKALHGTNGFAFYSDNSPSASGSQFTIQNAGNNITYMQSYNTGSASGGFLSMMNQGGYFTVGDPNGSEPLFVDLGSSVVGIGTESATSKLTVNGSFSAKYVAKTANYTATISDYTIDCTSGTFTVTLPTAVGITGRIYVVKNSGAGSITVATTSSQTIDGSTTYTLGTQYKYVVLQSNNSAWIVTGNN